MYSSPYCSARLMLLSSNLDDAAANDEDGKGRDDGSCDFDPADVGANVAPCFVLDLDRGDAAMDTEEADTGAILTSLSLPPLVRVVELTEIPLGVVARLSRPLMLVPAPAPAPPEAPWAAPSSLLAASGRYVYPSLME